jgi:hypothetical protein
MGMGQKASTLLFEHRNGWDLWMFIHVPPQILTENHVF